MTALAGLVIGLALSPQAIGRWLAETGPIESLTAVGYGVAAMAAWGLRRHPADDRRTTLALSVVMLACGARELDWHKAFTGSSVLRVSWYGSPASPLAKAVAALLLLAIVAALAWLVWRHGRAWREALRRREPVAVTIGVLLLVLVVSKVLDRSVGILVDDFGVRVPVRVVALRSALEEWLELGLPLMMLLGLAQHRSQRAAA